jgi:hypothetical protein
MLLKLKHKTRERIKQGPGWSEHIVQVILLVLGAFLTYSLATSPASNTAQNQYTTLKLDKYLTLAGFLRDGRNPHGSQHSIDYLPVHQNADTIIKWWARIDNYYQENILYFDDETTEKYKHLNQLVFDQKDILLSHKIITDSLRHSLKQPLADDCDQMIEHFRKYLDRTYGTESHSRFKF